MSARRLHAACAASALALTLGGCVAAAIPLAASSAMIGGPERQARADARTVVPADRAAAATAPATPYRGFLGYALAESARHPTDERRRSAVLADPGSLQPATTDCAILPPAVLIDLDPAGEAAQIDAIAPDPALADGLADLRAQDTAVFWISRLSAAEAGTLRRRLVETGLDPAGRDILLLMRRAGDRKQLRREELARSHCLLAIAGDERADFDELYSYLRDPAAASALEVLIDRGWFLVPTPPETKED